MGRRSPSSDEASNSSRSYKSRSGRISPRRRDKDKHDDDRDRRRRSRSRSRGKNKYRKRSSSSSSSSSDGRSRTSSHSKSKSSKHRRNRDDSSRRSKGSSGKSYSRRDRSRDRGSSRTKSSKKRYSRSSSSSSSSSSSNSSDLKSSRSHNASRKSDADSGKGSNLGFAALQAKIEEKLDLVSQVNRLNAIEDIEADGFVSKSFKSTRTKLEDIPLPQLELKPINLSSLKSEILCHPSLITKQREREEQWFKRLHNVRQKIFSEMRTSFT